ncbi:MAG: hypothetical protein AAGA30_09555, partial [Planctomycetota bacterium]
MPSFQQLQRALFIKRGLIVLAVALVTIVLYLYLQTDSWGGVVDWIAKFGKQDIVQNDDEIDANSLDDFERKINIYNSQQLILYATEFVDSKNLSVLVRLDNQRKKIQIAERLIELNENERAVNFGIATKLSALRTRELINQLAGLSFEKTIAELDDYSQQYLTANDDSVFREANLASVVAGVLNELLIMDETGALSEELISKYASACNRFVNDELVGRELFRCINIIRNRVSPETFSLMASEFKTAFENSHKQQLQNMANKLDNEIRDDNLELEDIFEAIDSL